MLDLVPLAEMALEPGPTAVATARHGVVSVLERHCPGLDEDVVETAKLLTSELVSNAVLHAGGASRVRVLGGTYLRIEVYDGVLVLPTRREHEAESVAGRGLALVEALSDRFGWELGDDEKVTWFCLAPPGQDVTEWRPSTPEEAPSGPVVHLLGVPIPLYRAVREYHEALLREYQLIRLQGHPGDVAGARRISAADRIRGELADAVRAALAGGGPVPEHVDAAVTVREGELEALDDLLIALHQAERLAAAGRLLVPNVPPEVVAVRTWWIGQIKSQCAGASPQPWRLPAPARVARPAPRPRLPWRQWVRYVLGTAVIADDRHVIVSMSARARLRTGWMTRRVRGERLTVLVPPRMRERHLAGYAQHLLTGRGRVLDVALPLPLWHREQREVPNTLVLTKHRDGGRTYFIAWCR